MVCTHHITMVHSKDWRGFGDILIVGISHDRQSHTYPSAPRIRLDILHPLDFAGALEALHVGAPIFSDLVVLGRGKSGKRLHLVALGALRCFAVVCTAQLIERDTKQLIESEREKE